MQVCMTRYLLGPGDDMGTTLVVESKPCPVDYDYQRVSRYFAYVYTTVGFPYPTPPPPKTSLACPNRSMSNKNKKLYPRRRRKKESVYVPPKLESLI